MNMQGNACMQTHLASSDSNMPSNMFFFLLQDSVNNHSSYSDYYLGKLLTTASYAQLECITESAPCEKGIMGYDGEYAGNEQVVLHP